MATIYDVAKAAGVSPKTVSRVLNGDAPVGKGTRKAVEAAMLALGYVPSNAARMMRSNKSGLIGLITGAITRTAEPAEATGLPDLFIVQGVQAAISASGKTLMIADTGGDSEQVPHLVRTFQQHRVEGLLYVADYHQQVTFPGITTACPVVLTNCYDTAGTPAVVPDDRDGQRGLVAKLIQSGHARIGYLSLGAEMIATKLRVAGYCDALEAGGIDYDPALVVAAYARDADETSAALMRALDKLLSLAAPPSVICCGNDAMAMRLYGVLRARGLQVPEDISVAGYDDYRVIAETLYPPLTTAVLPYYDIGRRAATRLLALIDGADPETENPTRVSGPVSWRSSVTALNQVRVMESKGRKHP